MAYVLAWFGSKEKEKRVRYIYFNNSVFIGEIFHESSLFATPSHLPPLD
jgi:hypothetical protein